MAKALHELAYYDASGFHVADFADFLEYQQEAMRSIYGQDINLDPDTQDGQWVTHIAQSQYDLACLCAAVFNSYSPLTASGDALSRQVKLNGIRRQSANFSTVDLKIIGKAGTGIINGKVRDSANNVWLLPALVTIPVSGEITVTATAQETGALRASSGAVSRIATPTEGWISVANESEAVPGKDEESDVALRKRQTVSTAQPSQSVVKGMLGDLVNLEGVTRCQIYENDTSTNDSNGIPSHSLAVVIEGGDAQAIAEVIRRRKTAGAGTVGSTSITLIDEALLPVKINFYRPTTVRVRVKVTIRPLVGYSSTYADEIKAQVSDYINSLGIGSTVYLSKLFVPANLEQNAHDSTYDIESIVIGKDSGPQSAQNITTDFNAVPSCLLEDVEVTVNGR